jgi:hypothetical protein
VLDDVENLFVPIDGLNSMPSYVLFDDARVAGRHVVDVACTQDFLTVRVDYPQLAFDDIAPVGARAAIVW